MNSEGKGADIEKEEAAAKYIMMEEIVYHCDIREVLENGNQETDIGFSSISIFPALYPGEKPEYEDEVYKGYCTWGRENMGISIVYQQENQGN